MLRSLLIVVLLGLAACDNGGGPADPAESVAGTYSLSLVNGRPLPVQVWIDEYAGETCTGEVLAGSITLDPGGHYSVTFDTVERCVRAGEAEDVYQDTETYSGTYVLSGKEMTLYSNGKQMPGTFEGRTLRIALPGDPNDPPVVMEFRK